MRITIMTAALMATALASMSRDPVEEKRQARLAYENLAARLEQLEGNTANEILDIYRKQLVLAKEVWEKYDATVDPTDQDEEKREPPRPIISCANKGPTNGISLPLQCGEVYPRWIKTGGKAGGSNSTDDKYSGMFVEIGTGRRALFKRDGPGEQIAEYVVSQLFNAIAARLELKKLSVSYEWVVAKDGQVALASLYEDSKERFEEVHNRTAKDKVKDFFRKEEEGAQQTLLDLVRNKSVQHYEIMVALSLLFGDYSIHLANIGMVGEKGDRRFIRFDFGAALRCGDHFGDQIVSDTNLGKRGWKKYICPDKDYYKRHHPTELTESREMAKIFGKLQQLPFDFEDELKEVFANVKAAFTKEPEDGSTISNRRYFQALADFCKRIGLDLELMGAESDEATEEMCKFLGARLASRKASMISRIDHIGQKITNEIGLEGLQYHMNNDGKGKWFLGNEILKSITLKMPKETRAVLENVQFCD